MLATPVLALIKNEIVMKMEKMNMPPSPYKCSVRRPVRSISGMETKVITTCVGKYINKYIIYSYHYLAAARLYHNGANAYRGKLGALLSQSGAHEERCGVVEDSIDAAKLLTQLHHNANDQWRTQCGRTDELHGRYMALGLLSALLGAHLLDVLIHRAGGAQATQCCKPTLVSTLSLSLSLFL